MYKRDFTLRILAVVLAVCGVLWLNYYHYHGAQFSSFIEYSVNESITPNEDHIIALTKKLLSYLWILIEKVF